MLSRIKAWLFPDKLPEGLLYLRENRHLLSEDDRIFARTMERRLEAGMVLHAEHQRRIDNLAARIRAILAW